MNLLYSKKLFQKSFGASASSITIAILLGMSTVNDAQAGVVFKLEDVTATPGETVAVGVFVTFNNGAGLDAFELPVDFGGDGRGFPNQLVGFDPPFPGDFVVEANTFSNVEIKGTNNLPFPFTQSYEAVFADNGPTIRFNDGVRTRLFDILVRTDSSLTDRIPVDFTFGDFPRFFNVVANINGTTQTFMMPDGIDLILQSGSISPQAVPEPSTWLLFCVLIAGWLIHRQTSSRVSVAPGIQKS